MLNVFFFKWDKFFGACLKMLAQSILLDYDRTNWEVFLITQSILIELVPFKAAQLGRNFYESFSNQKLCGTSFRNLLMETLLLKERKRKKLEKSAPVAIAINFLQACIYKSVKQAYF